MDKFYKKATDDSPEVILDMENRIFSFSGKSLPEDVSDFYGPVIEWVEEYSKTPLDKTVLDIKLQYFNTASSKLILDIFMLLEEIQEKGNEVLINWHYPEYDEEMKDAGLEYSEMVDLNFELVEYDS